MKAAGCAAPGGLRSALALKRLFRNRCSMAPVLTGPSTTGHLSSSCLHSRLTLPPPLVQRAT